MAILVGGVVTDAYGSVDIIFDDNKVLDADLQVTYTVIGGATVNSDYNALNGSILIASGSTSVRIYVSAIDDTMALEA